MPKVTIYHNPSCSKSRQTMALLEEHHIKPEVIEYLQAPPSKEELTEIIHLLRIPAKDIIRTNEEEWKTLGIDITTASEDKLIVAMANHPKIIQRPIVVANGKAALGRPPEKVLDIL